MRKVIQKTLIFILALFMSVMNVQVPAQAETIQPLNASQDLALNKPVTYSDVEGGKKNSGEWTYPQFVGESAVDGNKATRWSAGKSDEQWLEVDLEKVYKLDEITLSFHAESPEYEVLVSEDGSAYTKVASVTDGSQGDTVIKTFQAEGTSARYVKYVQKKMWKHSGNSQYHGSSIISFHVTRFRDPAESANLALNKTVEFSGVEGDKLASGDWKYPQFVGGKAVEGDVATRWSAGKTDEQWLVVDLADVYDIGEITFAFHAEAPEYEILISEDGKAYTSIANVTDGSQGDTVTKTFQAEGASARYIKYAQKKMWKHAGNGQYYGSSIIELSVKEYAEKEIKENTIRVGSFNIAAGKKPNVDALRTLTANNHLEIVGLQEVDMNTGRNNYNMLEKFQGDVYPYGYFSKAIDYSNGEYGVATASKYEILDSSTTFVDTTGGEEKRVYQRSLIKKGDYEIAFYNTHLSYETVAIRAKQLEELKTAIKNDPAEYIIVTGDFNADQYHEEFYTFLEEVDMVNGLEGNWLDTFNGTDATMKVNSIDNILYSRNLQVKNIEMIETTLSDHNLLTAEFEFLAEQRVSKEWLRTTIETAEQLDTAAYDKESLQALQETIENAKTLYEQEDVTQAALDEAVRTLKESIASLELYNLAYQSSVEYSGVEGGKTTSGSWTYPQFVGEKATDGDESTRWSADKKDSQWLIVDLGTEKEISEVILRFHAESPDYELLLSVDGENYTSVFHETKGSQGDTVNKQVSFPSQKARYVKYQQNKMWKHSGNGSFYGSSLTELEVYKEFNIEQVQIMNPVETISKGKSYQLVIDKQPAVAAHKDVIYTSSDNSVATISDTGSITALAAGHTTIKVASAADSAISATMELDVVDGDVVVTRIAIDQDNLTLNPQSKRFLTYTTYPLNAVNRDLEVVWSSSDDSVATISQEGKITALKAGSVDITVASKEQADIKGTIRVNVAEPDYNTEYDTMKERWQRRVIGENLDLSDSQVNAYVEAIDAEAVALWDTLHKESGRTTLWDQISSDTASAHYTTQFTKIKKLALAYGIEGTSLYENKALLSDILEAIDFMVVDKKYNGTYSTGNWWDWQIGCTQPLVDTLMILTDYTDYKNIEPAIKAIEGYAKEPAKQWPSYTATGANRTDIGLSVLGSAIIAKNDDRMRLVQTQVPDVLKLVTSGDGLYADGSVIQHTKHAYSGSYGNELIKGIGKIKSIVAGTSFDLNDPRIVNLYETISKGYLPLMHKGAMMSMVNGRSISRAPFTNPFTTEFAAGAETISNIMLVAQFAPEPYRTEFESALKAWIKDSDENYDFFAHARDFDALLGAKEILANEDITAATYEGMKIYGSMDRIVQVNDTVTFGLSMYSSRIYNYEFGNTENKKGFHTGDGVIYTYNNDLLQYGEGYWPTVDPYRLPGTTVDTKELSDGAGQGKTSPQSWVGGATDGANGVAGMYYNSTNLGTGMDTKAQKSYFFFNGKLIALGANISGTTNASIETTIENRMLTSDENKVSINGEAWDEAKATKDLKAGSYVFLQGTGTGNDMGYYFPEAESVYVDKETRKGTYEKINSYFVNDKEYSNTFFKMGINHGQKVENGKYSYVMLPGKTSEEVAAYAKENTLEILRNDADIQAVRDGSEFAMNVWPENWPAELEAVDGIKIDHASSVYSLTENGTRTIVVSDPRQKLSTLTLNLTDGYEAVISHDDTVTVNADGSFTINTAKSAGASHKIVVKLASDITVLEELITKSDNLTEETYTISTWATFAAALQTAKAVYGDGTATQSEIDAAAAVLQEAVDQLEKRAEQWLFDSFKEHVDTYRTWEEAYSAEEFAQMKALLDEADALLAKGPEQLTARAISALDLRLIDAARRLNETAGTTDSLMENLRLAITAARNTLSSYEIENVRPGKVEALEKAVEAGQTLLDADTQDRTALKQAISEIVKAAQELWQIVDKGPLLDLLEAGKAELKGNYTDASLEALKEAITQAEAALDKDATEAQVKEAYGRLAEAIASLVKIDAVDKEALQHQIAIAEQIIANIKNYVPSTVKGLEALLEEAKRINEDESATQEAVNKICEELTSANMKARTQADKSALQQVIAAAQAIDESQYTVKSVAALKAALSEGMRVFSNPEATEAEVKAATASISEAMKALEKSAGLTPVPDGGGNEADTQKPTNQGSASTGDATNTAGLMGMLILGVGAMLYARKRRQEEAK